MLYPKEIGSWTHYRPIVALANRGYTTHIKEIKKETTYERRDYKAVTEQ